MIMIPILILQIFLFPFTAGLIMNGWADSRRTLALHEVGSHIGSSIQQLFNSLNHETITAGAVTNKLDTPPFIESYPYEGTAKLRTTLDPALNSSRVLDISLRLVGANIGATASVTLGLNVQWLNSTLQSNSTTAGITAQKLSNGTIQFSFGV